MNTKNTLAAVLCLSGLCFALAGRAASAILSEPSAVGAWSPEVGGVQGRLLVAVDGKINGTRMSRIYLELRNVADLITPISVDYGSGSGLKLEVVDSQNRKVAPDMGLDFDAFRPDSYNVVLPHDSCLRFLVSISGYGIPKNAGTMLELGPVPEGVVILPSQSRNTYFLRGTFSVQGPKRRRVQPVWYGLLTLPPVQVPL